MIDRQPIDTYATRISEEKQTSVITGATASTEKRQSVLFGDFPNTHDLRRLAGQIKDHTLHHLDHYLEQAEAALSRNGVKVHFADTDEDARQAVLSILRDHQVTQLTKSKSMASEEIHLNPFLIDQGIEVLESDLGEFIIQLDGDEPSHIVRPIIHKNRREIARTFQRAGIARDLNDDPEVITRRARAFLREKYMQAQAVITGGNFISCESGRVVLVTNEGNSRFGMAPSKLHIALIGIEKLVPSDRDLGVFLNLLGRSATGQQLTVYTEFISGPKDPTQPSGPEEMHVVLMNNGRTDVLASDGREILRCIRCSACQNVCPVYRQASGHAYRSPYGGPIGAVLSPLLFGDRFPELADLPKASSLCGACNEVCPVDIPIPDLLLRLRDKAKRAHISQPGDLPMAPFATLATSPSLWRTAMTMSKAMNHLPIDVAPFRPIQDWLGQRTLPESHGGDFRKWLKNRSKEQGLRDTPQ
ncbi:L-lactate dehydrogenase complex protein LldF [Haloferula luteola]|uniref:L-lactate dehydrogenase complex protein LldF n=1 Tax=Haloferula luteola TaxID=595692 RepID=A0A840VH12_9BACT|nr:lactate utilization protein B [Haloferula luteola]MBB5353109.1 L-lactate dehydrogenase complex protein LldF [Haloferula luteola]